MKILIISGEFVPFAGGAGTYCYYLTKALALQGDQVTVLTKEYPDFPEKERIVDRKLEEDYRVKCIRLPYHKFWFIPVWSSLIRKFLKKNRDHFDFVILNSNISQLICSRDPLFSLLGKYVAIHHGKISAYEARKKSLLLSVFFWKNQIQKLYRNADTNIAVSENLKMYLKEHYAIENIEVVRNCIDTDIFHPHREEMPKPLRNHGIPEGKQWVLTASRLIESKNTNLVIRVFSKLAKFLPNFPELILIIAGEGKMRKPLEKLKWELGLEKQVVFIGQVSQQELCKILQETSLFLLLSREESFGLVFLEANACGVPVIGSRIDGIPEAIEEGKSGYLVDFHDETEILKRMVELLTNPERRRELGEYGRQRVLENFSLETLGRRIHSLLER